MRTSRQIAVGLALLAACESPSDDVGDAETSGEDTVTDTDESESGGGETPTFATEVQPILESACLCHFMPASGGEMTAPYLILNAGVGLGELVDVDAVQVPSMKRVAAGDVQNSYLVHKLRGTHVDVGAPADTDPMPPLLALDETDIATIEAWIAGGAPG
jgi:hypothetical protein